jgi:hypothetical protein
MSMTFRRIDRRLHRSLNDKWELRSTWKIDDEGFVVEAGWFAWTRFFGEWECLGHVTTLGEAKALCERALWDRPRAQMRSAE